MIIAKVKLRNLREVNGLSIDDLSEITGIRRRVLYDYESGLREPRMTTVKKIIDCVEKHLNNDNGYEFDSGVNLDLNKPDYDSYTICVDRLLNKCGELLKCVHDGNSSDSELVDISKDICNLSSSLHFIFHKTSILLEPFDEQLIAFTVKNTINKIIDSFNIMKLINDALVISGDRNLFTSNIRTNLRDSLHSVRYIVFYINDYFKIESDTVFILEKSDGTIYSLSRFHEKRMGEL